MRPPRFLFALALTAPVLGSLSAANAGQSAHPKKTSAQAAVRAQQSAVAAHTVALVSYREEVEPIFKSACGSCHSSDKHSSGFVVETPAALFKGGTRFGSKVVVPGKPAESVLLAYLHGTKQPRMPLNSDPLAADKLKIVEIWIEQGAKIDAVKLGFPYTAPVAHAIPHVKNAAWIQNPVDAFILAKLESKGLKPAPPAPKFTLLRRVYADLIGEPPTPQEADTFLNDSAPNAYEKLVDRLLADSRYGERWARHWLDLVRFAETHGFENDGARPHAWRYRDYVIRAFNSDKPYDRFLKEQIGGDELYPADAEALTATGFARLGPWDELSTDPPQRWQDYLNDVTDTTGSVVLGLTVGCARCHNHKYDRITQADYYRLQSFYAGTKWVETRLPDGSDNPDYVRKTAAPHARLEDLRKQLHALRESHRTSALAEKQKQAKNGATVSTIQEEEIDRYLKDADRDQRNQLESDIRGLESQIAPYEPVTEAISEDNKTGTTEHLLLRGSLLTPGPEVKPGFVAALVGGEEKPAEVTPPATGHTSGRRAALANWLGSRDNPMTARVMVNRIWQHHFGKGIVASPSDFGRNGDRPSHPELLDWLAIQFMDQGWSVKKMHRLMLLSNTYRMSSKLDPVALKADPYNALLWRMNRIRLEGEPLRDSILAVSGRLNPAMGGPSVYPKVSDEVLSTGSTHKWGSSSEADGLRRTIYVFQRRSLVLPIVEAFDGADMTNTCPRRSATTIAPQALALFNGEFTRTEATFFAERVAKDAGNDKNTQIERAYQIALCRRPTASQKQAALEFLARQTQLHLDPTQQTNKNPTVQQAGLIPPDDKARKEAARAALADFCHILINTNEFIYLD
jgi:mono/diheme cytochrome c family protein